MDCWLARDGFGMLQLHHSKPIWDDKKEDWISGLKIGILSSLDFEFKNVTFENSPVKVEINFKISKMEKKINIAELLKDCPKGMELDCTMYEDVYFDYVDELNIIHCYIKNEGFKTSITFNQHGTPNSDIKSKCVIFPKGKTTWKGFVPPVVSKDVEELPKFNDGDILAFENPRTTVFIYRNKDNEQNFSTSFYVGYTIEGLYGDFHVYDKNGLIALAGDRVVRHATEEEKEKLFEAIESNGYKWNPETKTLEELPKFKVGDRIKHKVTSRYYTIEEVKNDCYYTKSNKDDECFSLVLFLFEKDYELVPNKFDISSLIPYESKVLVRNSPAGYWMPTFWGAYIPENDKRHQNRMYLTTKGFTNYCIPFEGNEALMGTTNDCEDFYKIWEE